jgi:IS1 family transposase
MANQRLSKEKRVLVLGALCEGTPINAVCRMFGVGKNTVLRIVEETGEALNDYMHRTFRDIAVDRLAMDEQWQYVGKHGQRMAKKEAGRGDFWLWAGIDSDTKLIVSFRIGRRDWSTSEDFIEDIASRIVGHVQIATDPHRSYVPHIRTFFGERGSFSYATETKEFNDPFIPSDFPKTRKNGIPKIVNAKRKAVFGEPDLATTTTCHIERFFLTVRQELKRYQRLGLGYSKKLSMHRVATALQIGIYNLVRKHSALDRRTPAQAAGLEKDRWTLERVVEMSDACWAAKDSEEMEAKRAKENAAFEADFEELGL